MWMNILYENLLFVTALYKFLINNKDYKMHTI